MLRLGWFDAFSYHIHHRHRQPQKHHKTAAVKLSSIRLRTQFIRQQFVRCVHTNRTEHLLHNSIFVTVVYISFYISPEKYLWIKMTKKKVHPVPRPDPAQRFFFPPWTTPVSNLRVYFASISGQMCVQMQDLPCSKTRGPTVLRYTVCVCVCYTWRATCPLMYNIDNIIYIYMRASPPKSRFPLSANKPNYT